MPSKKISELDPAGALTGAELVEAVQGGVNVKTTAQDIADLGGGVGGADWGDIGGTLANQTDLQSALDNKQTLDDDLSAIAALSPSNDDIIQRKEGAWTNRTLVQLMTDLGITVGIASTNTTGTAIAFAVPQIYGLPASPETGNITLVTTGLQKGMVQVLYHNDASEPSYPAEFVKIGGEDYEGSTLNIYYMHALSTTRIEYTISHEI